jgi:hypothetical protein
MPSDLMKNFVCLFAFILLLETWSHYVAQAGLKLKILLLQTPKCWNLQTYITMPKNSHLTFQSSQFARNSDNQPIVFIYNCGLFFRRPVKYSSLFIIKFAP